MTGLKKRMTAALLHRYRRDEFIFMMASAFPTLDYHHMKLARIEFYDRLADACAKEGLCGRKHIFDRLFAEYCKELSNKNQNDGTTH